MSRLVGRKLQGTLGAHAASGLEAVPRYARRQKSLLGQGGGFWNYRWRSITDRGSSKLALAAVNGGWCVLVSGLPWGLEPHDIPIGEQWGG